MSYDLSITAELRVLARSRVSVCGTCPKRGEGKTSITFDGRVHSGLLFNSIAASMRVTVPCGACNGQLVKPETKITSYMQCSRFQRAERNADRQRAREALVMPEPVQATG